MDPAQIARTSCLEYPTDLSLSPKELVPLVELVHTGILKLILLVSVTHHNFTLYRLNMN